MKIKVINTVKNQETILNNKKELNTFLKQNLPFLNIIYLKQAYTYLDYNYLFRAYDFSINDIYKELKDHNFIELFSTNFNLYLELIK